MKKLKLFLTTLVMLSLGLSACDAHTNDSSSKGPEWTIVDGHLFHFDEDLGEVVGPKGDKGDQGEQGIQGEPGKDGVNGVDGKDGANGKDGLNGKDGVDGKDGKDGENGPYPIDCRRTAISGKVATYTIYYSNDSSFSFDVTNSTTCKMTNVILTGVKEYFTNKGISNVTITTYSCVDLAPEVEVIEDKDRLDFYIKYTNRDEMINYKDALRGYNWSVIGENDGNYTMRYSNVDAFVDLNCFDNVINISFFVGEENL